MKMMLADHAMTEDAARPVDCERLSTMGLAELLYHALVEWGRRDVGVAYHLVAGVSG